MSDLSKKGKVILLANGKFKRIFSFEDRVVKNTQIIVTSVNMSDKFEGIAQDPVYFLWCKKIADGKTIKLIVNSNFKWLCDPNDLKKQTVVLCGYWGKSGWTTPYSLTKNGKNLIKTLTKTPLQTRMEQYFQSDKAKETADDDEKELIDNIFGDDDGTKQM